MPLFDEEKKLSESNNEMTKDRIIWFHGLDNRENNTG